MNWTGGRLQQSRRSGTALTAQQAAYCARARARLQQGPATPPLLSILQEFQPNYKSPHILTETSEFSHTSRPAQQPRPARRALSVQCEIRPPNTPVRENGDSVTAATNNDAHEEYLKTRRLALLQRPNWLEVLPTAKPLEITFESYEDRRLIGRRRKLKEEYTPAAAKRFKTDFDLPKMRQSVGPKKAEWDHISVRVGSSIHGSQRTASQRALPAGDALIDGVSSIDGSQRITHQRIPPERDDLVDDFPDQKLFTSEKESLSSESMLPDVVQQWDPSPKRLHRLPLLQVTQPGNPGNPTGIVDLFVSGLNQALNKTPRAITNNCRLLFSSSPYLKTAGDIVSSPPIAKSMSSKGSVQVEPSQPTMDVDFGSGEEEWRGFLDIGLSSDTMLDTGVASSDDAEHMSTLPAAATSTRASHATRRPDKPTVGSPEFSGFSDRTDFTGKLVEGLESHGITPGPRSDDDGPKVGEDIKEDTKAKDMKAEDITDEAKRNDDTWYEYVFGHKRNEESDTEADEQRCTSMDSLAVQASDIQSSPLPARPPLDLVKTDIPPITPLPSRYANCRHGLVAKASSSPDVLAFPSASTALRQPTLPQNVIFKKPAPFSGARPLHNTLYLGQHLSSPSGSYTGDHWRKSRAIRQRKSGMTYMPEESEEDDESGENDAVEEGDEDDESDAI